ncbi:MAG: Methionyl-tRNA formyltransferase [Candidatus Roizmanbacteria bacterium GW2011_GWA2_35_8]|uniref:methionyl-tRNA formyltransferase n=1 Tax=Candidatus Roizmanbacteria bacterium GW2011_GWA2_35_8 TaxID=1618479 RepID=A0A0G0G3H4_9BACT|nr:MAG: Methionyl-tRNA formyltransferase [Candidatus Roizmanbacteria bacterium GW2011_GWA2_35_8]
MNQLKIVFFGSSYFSADFLEKILLDNDLKKILEVKFVVTQPDQKSGRKQILTPTPTSNSANKYNIECLKIDKFNFNENFKLKIENFDLCLVYAYGAIIPKEFLNLPKYGFWCIHPSLLPKYRGTSPMATSLINGDKKTGVTIIKMDEKIDHGPIIDQDSYTILDTDYRTDLENKLTDLGFEMFKKVIKQKILSEASTGGKRQETGPVFMSVEQNHADATYTKKLTKQDGFISIENLKLVLSGVEGLKIENSSKQLYDLFRGLYPWPGVWTILPNGKRLKITGMSLSTSHQLLVTKVQLEGKTEIDFKTFNKAYNIF